MNGSLTINLSADQMDRILRILAETGTAAGNIQTLAEPESEVKQKSQSANLAARELAFLLSGRTERLVRFLTSNQGDLYNDDLAHELGFENAAYTSSLLGKVTGKLRRVGIQAEGRNGVNWYSSRRVGGRTRLRVRPDVLKVLEEAVADIPR
jgi:hypothetical protein